MQLFGTSRLESFVREHEDSCAPLSVWQLEAEEAQWTGPEDVRARYANAIVQPDRVVFDIRNLYKIDVKAKFKRGVLLVERVWTTTGTKQVHSSAKSGALRSKA